MQHIIYKDIPLKVKGKDVVIHHNKVNPILFIFDTDYNVYRKYKLYDLGNRKLHIKFKKKNFNGFFMII